MQLIKGTARDIKGTARDQGHHCKKLTLKIKKQIYLYLVFL